MRACFLAATKYAANEKVVRILLIALLALVFCPLSAFAQGCTSPNFTWSGGNGSWNTAINWTPNGTPTTSSNTCINTANSAVTVSTGSTGTLQLALSTDSLGISDNTTLTVAGSSILNAGTINLNSVGDTTELSITGTTTLSGTGTLIMSNHASNYILGGGTLTNQSTIKGSGIIGNSNLTLVNSGTINANQSVELVINPNGGTTNSSTVEASAGGTMEFRGDSVTNTGGTILSTGTNSVVDLNGVSITNGTLTTSSGGLMQAYGGTTLTTLTISTGSTVNVLDNNTVNLGAGTITNNGTISENSIGSTTELSVAGSTTLSGSGTVTMSDRASNYILGGGTLTNDETIQGSGIIGNANLTLVNNATIDANQSVELVINPNGGTTNTKTMEATAGGTMEFRGDTVTNTGVGTILATGTGSVVDLNGVTVNGGTLTTTAGGLMQAYGGALLNGVTISSGSAVHVLDNQVVQLNAGTITNNGTINIDSVGDNTELQIVGGAVTLTGSGKIVMTDKNSNYIFNTGTGTTLTNLNNTISGSGDIGNNQNLIFVNQSGGIVDAVSSLGHTLTINPGTGTGAGTTNTGLMEASSGGTLVLNDTVTNTGGTITALTGGIVDLAGTDLIGGTLTSTGTGVINGYGSALLDGTSSHPITLTAGSNLVIPDNQVLDAAGTLTNNGTLTINSAGDTTILSVASSFTLTGSGTLTMSPHATNYIFGGGTLNNQSTIQGSGVIGNGDLTLVNSSTIDANQSAANLTINPNGGTTNTATMEATMGGTLVFTGDSVTNTGGTLLASGTSSVVDLNGVSITGGTLTSASGGIFQAYNGTTLNTLTISTGSTLNVLDNNSVNLGAGTITNNGTINENSIGDNTSISIAGSTTLAGTGTLTMSAFTSNYIQGGGTLTNQETIQGSGVIGNGNLTLVNNATIDANQSAASLTINPNGNTTNTKTLEATAGGTLIFAGDVVTNTGTAATILATGSGSTVDLGGVTVKGGTLTTAAGGVMNAYGSALLNGVTISSGSTVNVLDNNSVDIEGTITNKGTIAVNSVGDNTFLTLAGDTTLTAPGKIVLSAHPSNYINGSGTLTNQGTVEGEGHIGNGDIGLVNTGSILANETGMNTPSILIIDTGAAGFTNNVGTKNGVLNASAKNTLIIEGGAFANMDTTTGTLTGGIYDATGTLEFAAGTSGIVTNDATISLTSATGAILNTSESNASALSGFTTNGTKGSFSVTTQKFTDINNFTNQGTLIAGSGGTLDFSTGLTNFNSTTNTLTGGTYNVTGTLEFPGANIVVNNAIITLTGTTPKILNSTTTLSALTGFNDNKGTFTVNGGTFTDTNSFTNTGTLAAGAKGLFNASGGLTNFNNTNGTLTGGSYTLTTTGQIQFNNEGFANDIVTNDAKITLAGVDTTVSPIIDQTGANALANFTTNGVSGSVLLTTDRNFTNAGSLTNAGIVNVEISSGTGKTELIIGGAGVYTQTGGTTTVDGVLSASGGINIQGGFLYGNALTTTGTEGTLIGPVNLTGGTLNPGNAVKLLGTIDITGTYAESGTGILNIDLDGTTPGTKYDVLNVSGAAALGGTIDFVLNSAFKPVVGDMWDVLNYASASGSFSNVILPTAPTGDHYVFTCGATDCTLILDAGAAVANSAAKGSVSGAPATRVSRGSLAAGSTGSTHEPVAILSRATCFAARMIGSASCGDTAAVATASHGSEIHAVASAERQLRSAHNNIMVATRSISSARGGASHETSATAMAIARLYVCAYLPSTVGHTMGCN